MCRPTTDKMTAASASAAAAVRTASSQNEKLSDDDKWIKDFDFDGFYRELRALGKELEAAQGDDDVRHLNKIVGWSNACAAVGLLSMGFGLNLLSIVALSTYTFSRWTMIAHHTCHGGYDKVHPDRKGRWHRFRFGVGSLWRRFNDWFDWMMPEAWNVEHNTRHHYNLSEVHDPDLVEHNMAGLRDSNKPMPLKYLQVFVLILTWKWFYYAPNTYKELKLAQMRRQGKPVPKGINPTEPVTFTSIFSSFNVFYSGWEFLGIVIAPYLIFHFFVAPLPLLFLGEKIGYGYTGEIMYWNAVKNLFCAELLTNVHAFVAIVTNHAGDDMYRFRHACRPYSGSFFLRQVLASVDFSMGTDLVDFLHGWLNYQIEHHLWPHLSMLSYQRSAPKVREICAKYGVPYVQQNVFWRVKKTVDIMVGSSSMKWFPEAYENAYLEMDKVHEAEKNK